VQDRTIGVAGLGLLGRGIAACCLAHGFRVVGYSRRETTHAEALEFIDEAVRDLVERAGFAPRIIDDWRVRFVPTTDLAAFAGCEFVVESVVEDLETKRVVFDAIEAVIGDDVPVASNTSAIPITVLQQGRRHPQRFLGMHWAEPAHATRFLEIVRGEQTSDEAFESTARLARLFGKEPSLVRKDVPAFVVNRIGYAMYREALHILESGIADVETIDRSCRNAFGLWATMCGPFRWIDITGGPELYGRALEGVLPTLSTTDELPRTLRELMEAGAQGSRNGRGFYEYDEAEARRWDELYREHAWRVRALQDEYFGRERDGDA